MTETPKRRGGVRPGAGRPPGRKNRATIAREATQRNVIDETLSRLTGEEIERLTPLEVMRYRQARVGVTPVRRLSVMDAPADTHAAGLPANHERIRSGTAAARRLPRCRSDKIPFFLCSRKMRVRLRRAVGERRPSVRASSLGGTAHGHRAANASPHMRDSWDSWCDAIESFAVAIAFDPNGVKVAFVFHRCDAERLICVSPSTH
jgi:hypothetical protein